MALQKCAWLTFIWTIGLLLTLFGLHQLLREICGSLAAKCFTMISFLLLYSCLLQLKLTLWGWLKMRQFPVLHWKFYPHMPCFTYNFLSLCVFLLTCVLLVKHSLCIWTCVIPSLFVVLSVFIPWIASVPWLYWFVASFVFHFNWLSLLLHYTCICCLPLVMDIEFWTS